MNKNEYFHRGVIGPMTELDRQNIRLRNMIDRKRPSRNSYLKRIKICIYDNRVEGLFEPDRQGVIETYQFPPGTFP